MKTTLIAAMLISTALVAPLVYLELRYAAQIYTQFPYTLFGILWLLAAAFVLAAAPLIRTLRAGESVLVRPPLFIARVGL
jgi:hypothetical protein